MYSYEQALLARGRHLICGVDEAGAGPLAGPVYAAAVVLNPDDPIEGLNDSKKLSESKREALLAEIQCRALCWALASVDADEIDRINILEARMLAMRLAVSKLEPAPDVVLVDGNRDPELATETLLIVKGDQKSASIAAASIVAKVYRDRYMLEQAKVYPQYCFEKHKGYPTKLHYERLIAHGASPIHRKSFLKKLNARSGTQDAP